MATLKYRAMVIIFILLAATAVNGQKRAFTLDDIYKVQSVSAPAVSPSGAKLAYTITKSVLEKGESKTAIWVMDADGSNARKLDLGEKSVNSPMWGGTDNELYFLKSASGVSQLFLYDFASGREEQVTSYPLGVASPLFSPSRDAMVFNADVYAECGADPDCNKKNYDAADNGPVQAYMADKLLFRHWTFYTENRYTHIIKYDFKTKVYTDLTPGEYNAPPFSPGGDAGFKFSPDGKWLVYVSNHDVEQASSTNADVWLLNLASGSVTNITAENKAYDGTPDFSPDGKYIAYRMQTVPGYESDRFRLALYEVATGKKTVLTSQFDNWVEDFTWAADSKTLYFSGQQQGYLPVFSVGIDGKTIKQVTANISCGGYALSPDNATLYYSYRLMNKPAEVYKLNLATGKEQQLTFVNKQITEEVDFRPAEPMWFKGANGHPVHVWVIKPHGFDPAKKYPLIVNVHGGPQSQWMDAYRPDAQVYSGYGYIVAFPNPHGSTGYGQEYTLGISKDWGGKVYDDIMKVTDGLEALTYVDKDRVGAMGWSYGGYFMNWVQGHTKRYKCLVSMMGLYNLTSFYGTTEELWFPEYDLNGQPWNSELYTKFSPHLFTSNFATPTLIITGEKDYRVSYTQSLEYFTALQKLGIDSRIIIFKNDGHWPSHVRSMPLYYNAHLEWFNKYLGGQPAPYNSEMLRRNRAFEQK